MFTEVAILLCASLSKLLLTKAAASSNLFWLSPSVKPSQPDSSLFLSIIASFCFSLTYLSWKTFLVAILNSSFWEFSSIYFDISGSEGFLLPSSNIKSIATFCCVCFNKLKSSTSCGSFTNVFSFKSLTLLGFISLSLFFNFSAFSICLGVLSSLFIISFNSLILSSDPLVILS